MPILSFLHCQPRRLGVAKTLSNQFCSTLAWIFNLTLQVCLFCFSKLFRQYFDISYKSIVGGFGLKQISQPLPFVEYRGWVSLSGWLSIQKLLAIRQITFLWAWPAWQTDGIEYWAIPRWVGSGVLQKSVVEFCFSSSGSIGCKCR